MLVTAEQTGEPSPKDFVLLVECGFLYNKIAFSSSFFFFSSYPGDGVDVFRGSMVSSVSVSAGVMMDSV